MFVSKTKKWGNSIGLLIPKQEASRLNLQENLEVVVDIIGKENPFNARCIALTKRFIQRIIILLAAVNRGESANVVKTFCKNQPWHYQKALYNLTTA